MRCSVTFCQEQIYERLTDGRPKPPVLLSEQRVCWLSMHRPFASDALSVYSEQTVRLSGTHHPELRSLLSGTTHVCSRNHAGFHSKCLSFGLLRCVISGANLCGFGSKHAWFQAGSAGVETEMERQCLSIYPNLKLKYL